MKTFAGLLLLAAAASAVAGKTPPLTDEFKASLLRFEAWTATNAGISVFRWPGLQGAVAQLGKLPDGNVSFDKALSL
jgi:hypothetical protein